MEKAILHTVGEVPSNWVMSLTPEQQKELSDLSPEMIEHLPRVYDYYETAQNVNTDIEDTVATGLTIPTFAVSITYTLSTPASTKCPIASSPVTNEICI